MKYLITVLLLFGCSSRYNHNYTEKYEVLDISLLPECPNKVVKSRELDLIEYTTFKADNGYVLFVSIKGKYMCLQRKTK